MAHESQMQNSVPKVSVVIPTRNRGASVVAALESVFQNNHPCFEVIVVDQSTNQDTACAVESFRSDPRFRYVHSETQGAGRARNIGLAQAQGDIVAYTDDDCIVPSHWLEGIGEILKANHRVAMVFCRVEPASYNRSDGYIPAYTIPKDRILHSLRDVVWGLGLGAGMAFRRDVVISILGFDNDLGTGSRLGSAEEYDLAVRLLINRWWIYEASTITVTHFGFRSWREGKSHTKRDFFGSGAAFVKPIKCGCWQAGIMFLSIPLLRGFWEPFLNILHGQRPRGLGRIVYFVQGMLRGLQSRTDCRFILYQADETIRLLSPDFNRGQEVNRAELPR